MRNSRVTIKSKSLLNQWIDLKKDFPRHLVLIQCGVFYETYQEDAEFLADISKIKMYRRRKCNVAGFPIKSIAKFRKNIEALGYNVVIVTEIAWDGESKIRGIEYASGQDKISQVVQLQKRQIKADKPKKAARKTIETLQMAKSLKSQHKVNIALTQIGYMYNAFEEDARLLSEKIGLKSFEKYGYLTVGFPVNAKETYFKKIADAQISFVTIIEAGKNSKGSIRKLGEIFTKPLAEKSRTLDKSLGRLISAIDRNSLKAAALAHARNGFYVIPLVENSKKPLISDWQNRATTNPLQIDSWWSEHPQANIGIVCEVSNLIVIDLDTSKGAIAPSPWKEQGITNGEGVFGEICNKYNDLSVFDTYSVITPSGGKHLYFYDQNTPIKQGVEVNGWWRVDTRSKGGYIVAEGSKIRNSTSEAFGTYYSSQKNDVVLNFPTWLRDELTPKVSREAVISKNRRASQFHPSTKKFSKEHAEQVLIDRCATMRTTPEGSRNQTLIRHSAYIGKIIGMGALDENRAGSSLLEAAITSGLTRLESIDTIKRGFEYGKDLND